LAYSLAVGPTNAAIGTGTGVITWTPNEAQGPGVYTFTTVVTDNASPPGSATNSFSVTVNEVNSAPGLTVPTNQVIDALVLWTANATATDTDWPPNTLTFELVSGPSGLSVGAGGLVSWTPGEAQGPSTNIVTVRVFDDGAATLSATNGFVLTVRAVTNVPAPVIQSVSLSNGVVTIAWSTVVGHSYGLERKDDLDGTNWTTVSPPHSALGPTTAASEPLGDAPQRFYRVIRQP
jgi:hypothetical protein